MSDTIQYTNYAVAQGCIRIPSSITGRKDNTFARSGDFLMPGDAIPEGMISDRELRGMVASGTVREIATPDAARAAQKNAQKHLSKWNVDPATLGNYTLEDMMVMVQEIDPQYPLDGLTDQAARDLLTKDFDPDLRHRPDPVVARDAVSRLTAKGANDSGSRPLSEVAQENLAELQSRAQTPDASGAQDEGSSNDDDAQE